jgi:hypothetical protein
MGDRFGRRITLLVACTVSIAGALCNTFAKVSEIRRAIRSIFADFLSDASLS